MRAVGVRLDHRLAGRDAEVDLLARVVRAGAEGQPRAVIVHGEAGVGKTRLVREVCDDPDLLVLWGSCVHFGGASVPYAPIIGILQDWLAEADPAEQADVLADADELGSLLPGIGGARSALTGRLVPVVDLVLNRIAERHRTVVVVDDLHWADVASLDVLAYLITGFRAQRLTVLCTSRDEDRGAGHPLHGWLADMRRMPSFEEIHLERLEPADTGVQLEDLLGRAPDIDLITQVQARSDGNPYLTELLVEDLSGTEAVLPSTVPEGLRGALLAAWHRLSEQARQLVRVLAVGGRPTALDVLAAVASRHRVEAAGLPGCITEAQERGVLAMGAADPCWFRHPLLAEVLYDGLPPGEGPRIHASYLEVLEAQSGSTESVAADLAVHSQKAGRIDDAYKWSLVAAEYAAELRAPAEQAIQLERMCDLWDQVSPDLRGTAADRTALYVRASAVCSRVGRIDKAVDLISQALDLLDREREPLLAAGILVDRGTMRWHRTEPIEAVLVDIHEALDLTDRFPGSAERAWALGTLARAEHWQGLPVAAAHAEEAVRVARGCGSDKVLAAALGHRCMALSTSAPERALADAREAELLALSSDAMLEWMMAVAWQVFTLRFLGRSTEATDVALRGYTDFVAPGRDLFGYMLASLGAEGLLESGRWQDCRVVLRSALAVRCPEHPRCRDQAGCGVTGGALRAAGRRQAASRSGPGVGRRELPRDPLGTGRRRRRSTDRRRQAAGSRRVGVRQVDPAGHPSHHAG